MSEQEVQEPTDNQEVTPPDTAGDQDKTDWKAEARKWEARAKADKDAAEQWRLHQDSLKTEQQKLADEKARIESERDEANAKLARYQAAVKHQIPEDHLDLLTATEPEQIEAQAAKIAALIAKESKPGMSKPDRTQGSEGKGASSTADLFAAAVGDIL